MTNEERKNYYMNRNIKLYPPMLALVWDVLFVMTITTMYFTEIKGLTYSECMLFETILTFSACVMCIPVAKLFDKVTPIVSLRFGLLGYAAFLILCIVGNTKFAILSSSVFLAFGYCVLNVKGNPLLTDSLQAVNRTKEYGKIYGKGLSIFYCLEAVGAVAISYIYDVSSNKALAFYISLGCVALAMLLSFFFKDPSKFQMRNVEVEAKVLSPSESNPIKSKNIKQADSYFKILSSIFVISILLYSFMFRGVVSIDTGSFKIYLQQLTNRGVLPLWAFGCVYGFMKLCVALSNKYQFKYDLKFGVRSLIIFNVLLVATLLINGILFIFAPYSIATVVIIIISSCIQCSLRTPNFIFINNYLQVCMPQKNLEKLYAMSAVVQYLGYAVFSAIFSGLLAAFNDNYGYSILVYLAISLPIVIGSTIFLLRTLVKKYAQKYTIIKPEYTEDE